MGVLKERQKKTLAHQRVFERQGLKRTARPSGMSVAVWRTHNKQLALRKRVASHVQGDKALVSFARSMGVRAPKRKSEPWKERQHVDWLTIRTPKNLILKPDVKTSKATKAEFIQAASDFSRSHKFVLFAPITRYDNFPKSELTKSVFGRFKSTIQAYKEIVTRLFKHPEVFYDEIVHHRQGPTRAMVLAELLKAGIEPNPGPEFAFCPFDGYYALVDARPNQGKRVYCRICSTRCSRTGSDNFGVHPFKGRAAPQQSQPVDRKDMDVVTMISRAYNKLCAFDDKHRDIIAAGFLSDSPALLQERDTIIAELSSLNSRFEMKTPMRAPSAAGCSSPTMITATSPIDLVSASSAAGSMSSAVKPDTISGTPTVAVVMPAPAIVSTAPPLPAPSAPPVS